MNVQQMKNLIFIYSKAETLSKDQVNVLIDNITSELHTTNPGPDEFRAVLIKRLEKMGKLGILKDFEPLRSNPLYGGGKAPALHVKRLIKYIKGYTGRELSGHEGQEVYALLIHHYNDLKRNGMKTSKSLENKVIKDYIDDLKRRDKNPLQKELLKEKEFFRREKSDSIRSGKSVFGAEVPKGSPDYEDAEFVRNKKSNTPNIDKIKVSDNFIKKYGKTQFKKSGSGVKAVVLSGGKDAAEFYKTCLKDESLEKKHNGPEFYDRFIKKNPFKVKVYDPNGKYFGKKNFKTRDGAGWYARKQHEIGGTTKITKTNKKNPIPVNTFTKWLDIFIDEKGLDLDETIEFPGKEYNSHIMTYGYVIENIKIMDSATQKKIKDMLVKIDFRNGDIKDFLNHIAKGMIARYEGRL